MREGTSRDELETLVENIMSILEEEDAKIYSRRVIEEFKDPANVGRLADPDGVGIADGLCSDTMEVTVKVEDGRIADCRFFTDGCGATIACGSMLTKMVSGRTFEEARRISPEELRSSLGGLPEDHVHCATLAVIALRNALRDYETRRSREER